MLTDRRTDDGLPDERTREPLIYIYMHIRKELEMNDYDQLIFFYRLILAFTLSENAIKVISLLS